MSNANLQPLLDVVDAHGYCLVYDLQSREWRRLVAIDAREQFERGTVALFDPEGTEAPAALKQKMCPGKFVR